MTTTCAGSGTNGRTRCWMVLCCLPTTDGVGRTCCWMLCCLPTTDGVGRTCCWMLCCLPTTDGVGRTCCWMLCCLPTTDGVGRTCCWMLCCLPTTDGVGRTRDYRIWFMLCSLSLVSDTKSQTEKLLFCVFRIWTGGSSCGHHRRFSRAMPLSCTVNCPSTFWDFSLLCMVNQPLSLGTNMPMRQTKLGSDSDTVNLWPISPTCIYKYKCVCVRVIWHRWHGTH